MVSLLLIILYTSIFTFWLLKISRSYRNYLSAQQVIIGYITKISIGMAYGFLFWKFYNGDDTWQYHNNSLAEYQNLVHHPSEFLLDIRSKASGSSSLKLLYDTTRSFWNEVDDLLFIKMLAIFDVFSFGHYYVNVVLFCFVVFLGHLLLFRLLAQYYPKSAPLFRIAIFYNPMVLFWLSGIRKEGILFLAIAMALFYFDRLIRGKKRVIVNILLLLAAMVMLLVMRNFIFMCLMPSLIGWFLCRRFNINALPTFSAVYLICILVFFLSGMIPGFPDLAEKVTQRQYDYLRLIANTRLSLDSLHATASSYLHVLPQAINHSFFRPYITETRGILQAMSAADIILFFSGMILSLVYHKGDWKKILQDPLLLTLLFTSFFAYLLIGYTVPYPGTFIRYKAIFELLFTCIFAAIIDPEKIKIAGIYKI